MRDERLVAETLHYFSTANCALKQLVLVFRLKPEYASGHHRSGTHDWDFGDFDYKKFEHLAQHTRIAKEISLVTVSEEVRIELVDDIQSAGRHFLPSVHRIARKIGWACRERLDEDGDREERPIITADERYWCWSLRPQVKRPDSQLPIYSISQIYRD